MERPMTIARELSKSEFNATFSEPMRDVTQAAEAIVDLWAYADPVLHALFPDAHGWQWRVTIIYESADEAHQHLLLPVPRDNTYLVVVVAKARRAIIGHHLLDLRALYALDG